jgi:hypothetical protein
MKTYTLIDVQIMDKMCILNEYMTIELTIHQWKYLKSKNSSSYLLHSTEI